jgi:hypothetical protein
VLRIAREDRERDDLHCQRLPFSILNECCGMKRLSLTIVPSVAQLHPSLSDAKARFIAAIVSAMGSACRMHEDPPQKRKHEHDPYIPTSLP